jgi:8-oxo-dGTP pyrophosphatase MutT (NUDIX family)
LIRETEEECGITQLNFRWGTKPLAISHLTLFVAETENEPIIKRNPHSDILEHLFAEWMDWDALELEIIEYLIPALQQARKIIEEP